MNKPVDKKSVWLVILLSIVTLGTYIPYWLYQRLDAFNQLKSREKLDKTIVTAVLAMYCFTTVLYICTSIYELFYPGNLVFEKIIVELSKQKIEPKEILFIDNEAVAVNSAASLGISGHVYTKYHRLFIFLNQSRMKILTIISVAVALLVLSFIPFFTKSLMMGGEIKINFWQKYFMHID